MFLENMFKQPYLNDEDDFGGGSDDGFEAEIGSEEIDTMEAEESTQPTEPTEEAEDTKPAEPELDFNPFLDKLGEKVKFNHQSKRPDSIDDVATNYQKGMAFDKLQEKFNAIQNDPALSKYSKVKEVSELLGYQSDDELLNALYNTYYERTAETKGLTPQQIQKEYELSQKEKAVKEKEQTITQKEKDSQMYANFTKNFPGVTGEMISRETWEKVDNGMDLTAAYTLQQNKELQEQIKIFKQNQENSKKAPIGGVSKHGSEKPHAEDAFLQGFDED